MEGCPFCSTVPENVFWRENGFLGYKCQECGLLYVSPRPSESMIESLYRNDEAHAGAAGLMSEYSRFSAKRRLSILKRIKPKGKLLELGSGSGDFLLLANEAGYEATGMELNLKLAIYISETLHLNVLQQPLSKETFPPQTFDIIFHASVLSHLHNQIEQFDIMHKVLKQDCGLMVFETGNFGDLSRFWLRTVGRLQYPDHLFHHSRKSMQKLLDATGFEIIEEKRYGILPMLLIFQMVRFLHIMKNKPAVASTDMEKARKSSSVKAYGSRFLIFLKYSLGKIVRFGPQTVLYVVRPKPPAA